MSSFFKNIIPDIKKDLAKDAIKYVAAAIGGVLIIWLSGKIKIVDVILRKNVIISWYILILLVFFIVLISSFITWLLFNRIYQKLKNDSLHDELTGLYNEKGFKQYLDDSINHADRKSVV